MFQDLRYAARMLLKHRGFTCVAALTLALGIGANTAIFSLIDDVLLKSLPVNNPERLVLLERARDGRTITQSPFANTSKSGTRTMFYPACLPGARCG